MDNIGHNDPQQLDGELTEEEKKDGWVMKYCQHCNVTNMVKWDCYVCLSCGGEI